jgi:predicted DNA binding CopG/RHH family protein
LPREKIKVPSFSTERAEAVWWEKNRTAVEADLRAALHHSSRAPAQEVITKGHKRKLVSAPVRLVGDDLDAARKIAEDRGISFESYIRQLTAGSPR